MLTDPDEEFDTSIIFSWYKLTDIVDIVLLYILQNAMWLKQ